MNKFYMNGKLIHKASDHNTKRCEVEKWVFLPHSDFERLKANPYQEHEAITAARDLMYEDKNAYHCIMLLDEYGDDGLLIEAEGFDYPRLSMFVPDAALIYRENQIRYDSGRLRSIPCKDTRCIPYAEIRKRVAFSYWIIHSVFNSIADNHVHIGVLFL